MIRLIINGDDFGMNEGCTRAIAQAFQKNYITDTTVMANGAYFTEAIALAKKNGFADRIGVHLNLTEGRPMTQEISAYPDFVIGNHFHKGFIKTPRPLTEAEENAIYHELSAQIKKIEDVGIRITHADSHHYIHNLPFLAPIVARVLRDHGINKVRLQRDLGGVTGYEENNRYWKENGFITTAHFGRPWDIADDRIPDDTEILVHPLFDRDGDVVDNRGEKDGFPTGKPLRDYGRIAGVILQSYRVLSSDL